MLFRARTILISFIAGCLAGGCGGGSGRQPVWGTVSVNGAPLAQGTICFEPLAGEATMDGGVITAGNFRLLPENGLLPGRYRVRIYSGIPAPEPAGGPRQRYGPDNPAPDIVPAKFNTNSELEVEVVAARANVLDLKLQN